MFYRMKLFWLTKIKTMRLLVYHILQEYSCLKILFKKYNITSMKLARRESYFQRNLRLRHEFYQEAEWMYRDAETTKKLLPTHHVEFIKTLLKETKKKLACPICLEVIPTDKLKISLCGHAFCNDCLQKIDKCAVCRRPLEEIFNET